MLHCQRGEHHFNVELESVEPANVMTRDHASLMTGM